MLEPLTQQEAWSLLCNTTFREDAKRECPISSGNLLALKSRTEFSWKNVHDNLEWNESSDPGIEQVSSILNLSIDDLPYHLKRCFLHCSKYPEDFSFKRKILIRLWIAEDYVEEKGQGTMEETADDYLTQLVQRSLFQVTLKNEFGRAKWLCIHDLIRDLILQRSTKEGLIVFSKCPPASESGKKIRHLTLDRYESDHLPVPKMTLIRSFNAFMADMDSSLLSGFRLLTVLNLWFVQIDKLPSSLTNLLNLRYLGIRSTLIEELPHELGKLHQLQTLDAKWTMVQRLPPSITKLKSLRHLILFRRQSVDLRYPGPGRAIVLPQGLQNLTCLQTLKYIEADEKMVKSLGSLKQLKSLELFGMDESILVHLRSSISNLLRLGIVSRDANVILDLEPFYPPPLKLQKLSVTGMLARGCYILP
uniref:Uncharacterized protein n=1 Tax=Avena sativa TaxID=4498 RepID=A0ACD5UHP7_AVESA